jgi:hypothetical protein
MTKFNQKRFRGLIGLKFEVVFGIGFLINFHETLDLALFDQILKHRRFPLVDII